MSKKLFVFILLVCFTAFCFAQPQPRPAMVKSVVVMKLPAPQTNGRIALEQAIEKRRSTLQFTADALTVNQLSQLCWAAQGITDPNGGLRTAPSAGDLFSAQIYVLLPDGLYLYNPQLHDLTQQVSGDLRRAVANAAFGNRVIQDAPCTIMITCSMSMLEARYRGRSEKLAYLEAGHISQNILLQAVSLGLGSEPVSVIDSRTISQIAKLPQGLDVLYLVSVGNPVEKTTLIPAAASSFTNGQRYNRTNDVQTKRVAIIVPPRYFKDNEFYGVEQTLLREGIQYVISSTILGEVKGLKVMGTQRNTIIPKVLVRDLKVQEYDAFVFIGGSNSGATYFDNSDVINLVRAANASKKILAAINDSPAIFAYARIVAGRNVTSAISERPKLVKAGANWQRLSIVTDNNLITAGESFSTSATSGAADIGGRFGTTILGALRGQTGN